MTQGSSAKRTYWPVGLRWSPWVVGVALICAAAQAVRVEEDYEIGCGPNWFQVALIADPHNVYDNLRAARDTINKLVEHPAYRIQMALVLGDLSSADEGELLETKGILHDLAVPYVPLIGNHDVIPWDERPRGWDSLFTTRFFDSTFGSVYRDLASGAYSQIRDFLRYEEHPWNFEIQWGDTFAYDIWQNFSFLAGPELSPYRFVCLDFNSRKKKAGEGAWPEGDLHYLPFDNRTSSIRVRGGTGMVKCRVYEDDSLTGDSLPISYDTADLGSWKGRISSVWVAEGCTVDLYESVNYEGHVWLRLTDSDLDLDINGSAQWWRDHVKAYCDSAVNDTVRDNVIFFAHHPLWPDITGIANFAPWEVGEIASFLEPYARNVGGWYAGHLNDSGALLVPPSHGSVRSHSSKICDWYMVPANSFWGGYVKILTLYYGKSPLVDRDCSGLIDDTVDVTYEDTIPIVVKTLRLGQLTVRIQKGSLHICTLVTDSAVGPDTTLVNLTWDGRDSDGALALPGDDYSVRFYEGSVFMGSSPFTVKGTCIPAEMADNETWDTLHEPYVLAGHDFYVGDSATLTILPGVRVMFHDTSSVGRGIYEIYVKNNCRIEALGNAQVSVLFMPHRKMTAASSPHVRGWWGGIHLEWQSYGAEFSHCVAGAMQSTKRFCSHTRPIRRAGSRSATATSLEPCVTQSPIQGLPAT